MRIPGRAAQVVIHAWGKGIPPLFQIRGPAKRPIKPPITDAGRNSFLKTGTTARSRVPNNNKALKTQKQYSNWVSMALFMLHLLGSFVLIYPLHEGHY
jgi:hypothetical protein